MLCHHEKLRDINLFYAYNYFQFMCYFIFNREKYKDEAEDYRWC